jgi:peptide/nickel transport system permease protein
VLPTIAVTTAQAIGSALLLMASLTFLGLGVTPPAPTWGGMLASDLGYLTQQPWAPLFPGLLIMLTVGSLNLIADAIRDQAPDGVRRGWLGRQGTLAVAATSGLTGGGAALAAAPAPQDDVEPELTEEEDARVPAA